MKPKHKIRINVSDRSGNQQKVLESGRVRLPQRLLRLLFGEFSEILILTPGESVQGVEIEQMRGDGHE